MATKCFNKKSTFYKALVDLKFSADEIAQINDKMEQESFNKWYGEAERDSFGQPRLIKDLYISNDKGETITLNDLLNNEFYTKRQNYASDLTHLDKINDFLADGRVSILKRIVAYKGTPYADRLKKLLEDLDALNKNDYFTALEKYNEYINNTVEDIDLRLYEHDKENSSKLTKEEKAKRTKRFKNFLRHSSSFLNTFSKVKNLELPVNNSVREAQIINKLRSLETKVTSLQNRINSEIESAVRDTLNDLITNPDVRAGVVDFLAAQADEGKVQLLLDSLADSHVTFISAIAKFYKKNMYDKDQEVRTKRRDWDKFVEDIEKKHGDFNTYLKKLIEHKDGKPTGKFIQEFLEDYYDELGSYVSKLRGIKDKNSLEYKKVLDQYYTWKKDNTEQKFVKEYYDVLNSLSPKAREAKEAVDTLKSKILAKGKDKLTIEDHEALEELDKRILALKSSVNPDGTKKEGDDLDIANELFKYSRAMSKFYDTSMIKESQFNKAKRQAEEKGAEYLNDWMEHNTVETFTDGFWKFFNELIKDLPKSEELTEIEGQIKQLLLTYKNEKGEVKVEDLPSNVRKEIEHLTSKKANLKEALNAEMDLVKRRNIAERFRKYIVFNPTTEYVKTLAQKRKILEDLEASKGINSDEYLKAKKEYDRWYSKNHETNIFTGEETPLPIWTIMAPRDSKFITRKPNYLWKQSVIKQEYNNPRYREDNNGFSIPTDKWSNEEYNKLSAEDVTNLKSIQKLLIGLTDHTKNDIIKKGYLPALPKDNRTATQILFNSRPSEDDETIEKAITESDEIVKFIPFKYVSKVNQQPLPELGSGTTDEENKEIAEKRRKIIEENRKSHADAISYNLKDGMKEFIKVALTSKYKTEMKLDMELFSEQMKHQKVKVTNAKGEPIFDKIKGSVLGNKTEHEISAEGSNMEKHFKHFMDGVFYENFELNEGKWAEFADKFQNLTSLRSLGFNVLSTINNSLVGNLMERIESAGGQYFDYNDYRKAKMQYYANLTSLIANYKTEKSNNKVDAFQKYFDVLISQDELANKPDGAAKTFAMKTRMALNAAFLGQHLGEHQIQNTTLLAASYSHRVVDGKIVNYNEFIKDKQININWKAGMSEEDMQRELDAIDKNYILRKSLKEDFEKYPTVFDSFEMEGDYITPKKDANISSDQIFEFRQRIIALNQRLHGIYNTEDAATAQRYAIGRLAMQFRKWMRPGWNKRFGRRFGKKDYNENIKDWEEGMYISTYHFLIDPFTENYKLLKSQEEKTALLAYKVMVDGFKDLIFNAKIRWHSMSEIEKANVKRTAIEFLFLITVTAIGLMVKNMKGDDDDKAATIILYQADRLFGELSTFTPFGVAREGNRLFKSPSPMFSTLEDIGKLATNIVLYPFRDEEERSFKSGIYHGEDKVNIYAKDMIPIYTQWQRLKYMNENTQRYGMFR